MESIDAIMPLVAEGLERHFGFKEYEALVGGGNLNAGSTIAVFTPLTSSPPRANTSYRRAEYTVVSSNALTYHRWNAKPKKLLQGKPWYVVQRV